MGQKNPTALVVGVCQDTQTSQDLALLTGHTAAVTCVAFSADGKYLASGSADTTIRLWHPVTGKYIATLSGHVGGLSLLRFLPDGETLASGSYDDTIRLWDLKTRQLKGTLGGHSGGVHSITVSQDGSMLVSNGWQRNLLWNAKTGERLATFIEKTHKTQQSHNRYGSVAIWCFVS